MRELKFRYIARHLDTGNIERKVYTLDQIERTPLAKLSPVFSEEYGYEILGRSQYIGMQDIRGNDMFEGDIVQNPLRPEKRVVVEFSTEGVGSCGCCYEYFCGTGFKAADMDLEDCEIVGNIIENPQMLENPFSEEGRA